MRSRSTRRISPFAQEGGQCSWLAGQLLLSLAWTQQASWTSWATTATGGSLSGTVSSPTSSRSGHTAGAMPRKSWSRQPRWCQLRPVPPFPRLRHFCSTRPQPGCRWTPWRCPAAAAVVVVGGAGAVGGYAIQLAKADGLTVLAAAAASDDKLVRSLGADAVVDARTGIAAAIRGQLPDGAPGLIDTAALDGLALPAVADGGGLVTLKGWNGPSERGIVTNPVSSFGAASDTDLFDRLRRQAQNGILTLRVADVLPATMAAAAHRRLAAGGVRGRLVLRFSPPLW